MRIKKAGILIIAAAITCTTPAVPAMAADTSESVQEIISDNEIDSLVSDPDKVVDIIMYVKNEAAKQDISDDQDNVTVINNDILKVDIRQLALEKNQGRPIKVVANLPYYITTPIIMGLFENQVPVDSITIMVQKEVADRMQVGPGTKDYGALSLAVQYYAKPKIVANVPPNCFMPRPKVGSAVIRLERYEKPPVEVKNEKLMFRIIRASFNQRRKTLVNGLKNSQEIPFSKEQIEQALGMCGLSLSVRGEALTLAQFAQLANAFTEIS